MKAKTAKQWKVDIVKCMKVTGTYNECFRIAIDTLAQILEKRDKVEAEFQASGQGMTVEHTNKAGALNIEQNPLIRMINDLNRDALTYMRECGITPKGLRMINDKALNAKEIDPFEKFLMRLEKEYEINQDGEEESEDPGRRTDIHERND